MALSLIWLADVLEGAGLKVAPVEGWETRGRGDIGAPLGVMCHHTAGSRHGNMGSLGVLVEGRRGGAGVEALPGPLAHLGLGRDGTYYVIAAGRCNHAGLGAWMGIRGGNTHFIGIEAENTGLPNDQPWPDVQVDAYQRGVAAILKHLNRPASFCCGHREYALPAGRKTDPTLDMDAFRLAVSGLMSGIATPRPPIPAAEPTGQARPTLRRGATGALVKEVQKKLVAYTGTVDGDFGPKTEAAVRAFQRAEDLVPDGIVGPRTWERLDAIGTS